MLRSHLPRSRCSPMFRPCSVQATRTTTILTSARFWGMIPLSLPVWPPGRLGDACSALSTRRRFLGTSGSLVVAGHLLPCGGWPSPDGGLVPSSLAAFPWDVAACCSASTPWIAPAFAPSWQHRTRSRVVARSSYASVLPEDLYTPTPWSPFLLYADQAARTTPAVFSACSAVPSGGPPPRTRELRLRGRPRDALLGRFTASWSALHRVPMVDDVGADSWETNT